MVSCLAKAQKTDIIHYLDSCYYTVYNIYENTEDGLYINKYRALVEKDYNYLLDTNLNVILEVQIKSSDKLINEMTTLADTLFV